MKLKTIKIAFYFCLFAFTIGNAQSFKVLVFHKTLGYRHAPAIDSGIQMITTLGNSNGWTTDSSQDANVFTSSNLSNYKVIIFANTSGDNLFTNAQKIALENFIKSGGGFVGIHAASDTYRDRSWPWFNDLVGAIVQSGPNHTNNNTPGTMDVLTSNTITSHLGATWSKNEEWYYWEKNGGYLYSQNINLLEVRSTGSNSYDTKRPTTWYKEYDGGRSFYTALGHNSSDYVATSNFGNLIKNSIIWASQKTNTNNPTAPAGYTFSVNEGGTVLVNGTIDIAYGTNGSYKYLYNVSSNTPCSNATFGDPIPGTVKGCFVKNSSITAAPIGSIITLKASNNKFVTSANGTAPMFCDRNVALGWEKFTVVDAVNGKIALKASNGNYVSSENGNIGMTCNRASIGMWEKFDWVVLSNNKIALKGSNGKFVSSEDGVIAMNCNRLSAGLWEGFNWTNTGTARVSNTINYNEAIDNDTTTLYPNPTSGQITLEVPEHSSIIITDSLGKIILEKLDTPQLNIFDLSNHKGGIYFVRVMNNGEVNFKKLIVR